jgi:hypothetical protein
MPQNQLPDNGAVCGQNAYEFSGFIVLNAVFGEQPEGLVVDFKWHFRSIKVSMRERIVYNAKVIDRKKFIFLIKWSA